MVGKKYIKIVPWILWAPVGFLEEWIDFGWCGLYFVGCLRVPTVNELGGSPKAKKKHFSFWFIVSSIGPTLIWFEA